jgi:hypothetical protein
MADWRKLVNGAIRVYFQSAEKWPQGRRFLLHADDPIAVPDLDPAICMQAVNGHGDPAALWILAKVTAYALNKQMHPQLRGVPKAIDLATQGIFNQLKLVARDPLRWTYFSFPWGESGSELALARKR